jgi:hypothetical protein
MLDFLASLPRSSREHRYRSLNFAIAADSRVVFFARYPSDPRFVALIRSLVVPADGCDRSNTFPCARRSVHDGRVLGPLLRNANKVARTSGSISRGLGESNPRGSLRFASRHRHPTRHARLLQARRLPDAVRAKRCNGTASVDTLAVIVPGPSLPATQGAAACTLGSTACPAQPHPRLRWDGPR